MSYLQSNMIQSYYNEPNKKEKEKVEMQKLRLSREYISTVSYENPILLLSVQ